MSFEHNPADEDPHGECRHEIHRLQADLAAVRSQHHDDSWAEQAERFEEECTRLRDKLATIRQKLEEIVCTEEPDSGVVLLSGLGPTHYDYDLQCWVYECQNISPLGDALIELYELTK